MNTKTKATLEKTRKIMRVRNYSENTIKSYIHYLDVFLRSFKQDPYHISQKEAKIFLVDYSYSSVSEQNQFINAVKLFYREVLGVKMKSFKVTRPRKEKKLPRVVDAELVASKIHCIKNLKHKAILALGLGCGLRISETINLKWCHIERARRLIKVVNGKGKKDRYVPISDEMIKILEAYWLQFKSVDYVFNGQKSKMYSSTSVQRLVKKYIHPNATYHMLRHTFATHAIDMGNDVSIVAKSLGHNSIKTTQIYLHLTNKNLKTLKTAI